MLRVETTGKGEHSREVEDRKWRRGGDDEDYPFTFDFLPVAVKPGLLLLRGTPSSSPKKIAPPRVEMEAPRGIWERPDFFLCHSSPPACPFAQIIQEIINYSDIIIILIA